MVLGEALIDLLETTLDGQTVYRPAVGGAPLNVAVGIARLGGRAELLGSIGEDAFGRRIRALLQAAGVGDAGLVTVAGPTTLAVTSFDGNKPDFHFYGQPPSYGLFRAADLDEALVAGATVMYCGSIALLCESAREAARSAWVAGEDGVIRTFDPNVRQSLLSAVEPVLAVAEEFAATADLVKLSADDAAALYPVWSPERVVNHLVGLGARVVVLTLGPAGAIVADAGRQGTVPGVPVRAVDTTGAGDAVMAALLAGLLDQGMPTDWDGLERRVRAAMRVAALVCERRGGASAMPSLAEVRERWPR